MVIFGNSWLTGVTERWTSQVDARLAPTVLVWAMPTPPGCPRPPRPLGRFARSSGSGGRRQTGVAGQHANGRQRHLGSNPQHDRGSPQVMEAQSRPAVQTHQLGLPHLRTEVE